MQDNSDDRGFAGAAGADGGNPPVRALRVSVRGAVQGVGFRPFVHSLAGRLGLRGWVSNTSDGVSIEAEGDGLERFLELLVSEAPPLAAIASMESRDIEPPGHTGFRIIESAERGGFTLISPDVSTCAECELEMLDPSDRRFRYPFINCTNCGPRYSITESVPYDRPNTTMRSFTMCPACRAEYDDPSDRRFHAVPNACQQCGPRLWLASPTGEPIQCPDPIKEAMRMLSEGRLLAIKGLGGFHLACDARNDGAVQELRRRKQRKSAKPFALMAGGIDSIRRFCMVSPEEEALLRSVRKPVVLLQKLTEAGGLSKGIAPQNRHMGFMLPYTPLHMLLFELAPQAVYVMTSGNLSEEPIVANNTSAIKKLGPLVDALLLHDRDIFMRVDDSVVMAMPSAGGGPALGFVRRSRGYAPEPLRLSSDGPDVLAVGADLKNTFTLCKGPYAITSQHTGDMQSPETLAFFEEVYENLKSVYRAEPLAVAHDLHPGYFSTRMALGMPSNIQKHGVQHHHAHIASVMAEHGLCSKVIGVAFDGTGYGPDATLWGGEFLIADTKGFERAGHLGQLSLPGGEAAIREPWRIAVGAIGALYGHDAMSTLDEIGFISRYGQDAISNVLKVSQMPEFSPLSTGAGRLFDTVAALCGVADRNGFEGEAAAALEYAASRAGQWMGCGYQLDLSGYGPIILDFSYTLVCIINDIKSCIPAEVIAARFHDGIADAIAGVSRKLSSATGIKDIALSGGVFQNRMLLGAARSRCMDAGLRPHINTRVPANDGGVSLGQAYILREKLR